jgi:hypothetical protein
MELPKNIKDLLDKRYEKLTEDEFEVLCEYFDVDGENKTPGYVWKAANILQNGFEKTPWDYAEWLFNLGRRAAKEAKAVGVETSPRPEVKELPSTSEGCADCKCDGVCPYTPENCGDKVTPESDRTLSSLENRLDWYFHENIVGKCDLDSLTNTLHSMCDEGHDAFNDWPPNCDPVGLTIERLMTLVNQLTQYQIKRDELGYKHRPW